MHDRCGPHPGIRYHPRRRVVLALGGDRGDAIGRECARQPGREGGEACRVARAPECQGECPAVREFPATVVAERELAPIAQGGDHRGGTMRGAGETGGVHDMHGRPFPFAHSVAGPAAAVGTFLTLGRAARRCRAAWPTGRSQDSGARGRGQPG